jgi:hypothetical protein
MLLEIKRNSHIKIRERNRLLTYMCMHGPNFNEMLETKENILRLTYIMKINSPYKAIKLLKFKKNVKSYLRNITYMSLSKGYLSYIKSMLYKLVRKRLWTSFYNIKSNVNKTCLVHHNTLKVSLKSERETDF